MKVILYMAISIDGFIAKPDDDTASWISKTEWDSYSAAVRSAGWMIIGHRTYDILTTQPEFAEFKDVNVIVVGETPIKLGAPNHKIATSPQEALEFCKGATTVVVAGGGKLNAAFMAANLVDEMYIDIEPTALGNGIQLFHGSKFKVRLKLLSTKQLSPDEIQLHYQILK